MAKESSVTLIGMWASPFVMKARVALKIKGIEFDNIEEDLANKSEMLLKYNPVHKKVPVLVHNGLPIVESSIILEYIDEIWTQPPNLLPKDSYLRAKHRFWAAFFAQVAESLSTSLIKEGKFTEEMMEESRKKLDLAEEHLKEIFPNGCPSFHDSKPGYLDLNLFCYFGNSDLVEELFGIKYCSEERFPLLTSWIKAISEVPEVKEVQAPKPKMMAHLRVVFGKFLQPEV